MGSGDPVSGARRIAAVLGAALCLLAMTVSAMFPAENLVMSFRSPEDVFSYMESGEVLDVLEGDASCAVIYADGRHMGRQSDRCESGGRVSSAGIFLGAADFSPV